MKKIWWMPVTAALCILMVITLVLSGTGLVREPFSEFDKVSAPLVRVEAAEKTPSDKADDDSEMSEDEKDDEKDKDKEKAAPDEEEEQQEDNNDEVIVAPQYTDITDGNTDVKAPGDGGQTAESGEGGGAGDGSSSDEKKEGDEKKPDGQITPSPTDGPEDDTEVRLVTDLADMTITYDELEGDMLPFYAYLTNNRDDEYSLQIRLKNSKTSKQGTVLRTSDGKNYAAELARNETNEISVVTLKNGKVYANKSFYISYQANRADPDHPEVGPHPPGITTRLDSDAEPKEGSNQNYEFWVSARDYKNNDIYYSNIEVRLDGKVQHNVSGGAERYTYQLFFEPPEIGDTEKHTISVLAWDEEGNSRYRQYTYTYHDIAEGELIGHAYIILDASTVGCGIIDEAVTVEVRQGEPASYDVKEALEYLQYDIEAAGTLDNGYYISRISRPGTFYGAEIPELLRTILERDNFGINSQFFDDSLGQFDYTIASGWLFTVGGEVYSGKNLSDYYLSDGETLYLRFTLAYGKDVGGSSGQGGNFTTYCTAWLGGSELTRGHEWTEEKVMQEATCTQDGYKAAECRICGTVSEHIAIPASGHDWQEVSKTDPTCTGEGVTVFRCSRCHEERTETSPAHGHDYTEVSRTEAQPGLDGEIVYRCSACRDEYSEVIPALPEEEETPSPEGGE